MRLLLLEDSEADADLIEAELERAGMPPEVRRVDSRDAFVAALREFEPDIVLSDDSLGQFNALAALELVRGIRPATPVIVVSGACDERTTVACVRSGVEDVVAKHDLRRLAASIKVALDVRRGLERLSPRQLQVLRLVTEGDTTRDIARRLRLSVKTVESHRTELMKRLELHDVVALVRYAIRVGIVATSP